MEFTAEGNTYRVTFLKEIFPEPKEVNTQHHGKKMIRAQITCRVFLVKGPGAEQQIGIGLAKCSATDSIGIKEGRKTDFKPLAMKRALVQALGDPDERLITPAFDKHVSEKDRQAIIKSAEAINSALESRKKILGAAFKKYSEWNSMGRQTKKAAIAKEIRAMCRKALATGNYNDEEKTQLESTVKVINFLFNFTERQPKSQVA